MTAVIMHGTHAAKLTHGKKPELVYEAEYQTPEATPLSVNLPVSDAVFAGPAVRNWLLNLLPDDKDVIRFLRAEYDVPSPDPLHLLDTPIGLDCAGAVQFCADDQVDAVLALPGGESPVSADEVAEWLRRFPLRPAQPDGDHPDTGFSLAGMQPKVALRREPDGGWTRPWGRLPTTHILKSERRDSFPGECVFEHVALNAAARLGIASAPTEVADYDGMQVLIVERYDRAADGQQRIHQEDMCQATGRHPDDKYEHEGGPSAADVARVLRESRSAPAAQSVSRFGEQLLYSWLIANNDGHAKNYSILHGGAGSYVLAPLYDVCSWLPYRGSRPIARVRMAMSMGRGFNLRTCDTPDMFDSLAQRLGRQAADLSARAAEMAAGLPAATAAAVESLPDIRFDHEAVDRHLAEIEIRSRGCGRIAETAHTLSRAASRRG